MADQPLTLAVFEEFQRKVFEQLDGVTAVKEALALVEWKLDDLDLRAGELALRFEGVENRMAGVDAAVLRVDERLSRVEKRLGSSGPLKALRLIERE